MVALRAAWDKALTYDEFVREAEKNCGLWEGVYRTARIPDWAFEKACSIGKGVKLLVIAEDWCGDASNTTPILARLGHEAECLEMRVLKRDEHPEVMDQYLTNGTRSIPIVIALDSDFDELGYWGPRPSEVQDWVVKNKGSMESGELYKHVRGWYARDRGVSTLTEVLSLFEGSQES